MLYIERMAGQDYIDRTREYLDYIEEHLSNIIIAFELLSRVCSDMDWVYDDYNWFTVREQVYNHDLSKFSKEEFTQYRECFYPVSEAEKSSSSIGSAWEHHKVENSHHHETARTVYDIVHMVIDWTAMGIKYGDTAEQYYEKNKQRIQLSDQHRNYMFEIFKRIRNYKEAWVASDRGVIGIGGGYAE